MHCSIKALEILNKIKDMKEDKEIILLLEKELVAAENKGKMYFLNVGF